MDLEYSMSRVTIPSGVLTIVSFDISVTLYEWMLRRGVGVNLSSSLVELPTVHEMKIRLKQKNHYDHQLCSPANLCLSSLALSAKDCVFLDDEEDLLDDDLVGVFRTTASGCGSSSPPSSVSSSAEYWSRPLLVAGGVVAATVAAAEVDPFSPLVVSS